MALIAVQTLRWVAGIAVGGAVVWGGLLAFGAARWSRSLAALTAQLAAGSHPAPQARYHEAELATLPAPVQRYFRASLTDGQRMVTGLRVTQSGRFNLGTTTPRWKPFTATQTFTVARPGFVWDAKIRLFPGLPVRVVDAFVAGEGVLRPTLLGLFSMGSLHGAGEIARGEVLRHFAESLWFPTALLPRQGVIWTAVDATSAKATMTDGPLTVTLLFRFAPAGHVTSVRAEGRAMQVGQAMVQMPWECRLSQIEEHDGMRVPMTGEALYLTPTGERSYFKGTLDSLTYAFAD